MGEHIPALSRGGRQTSSRTAGGSRGASRGLAELTGIGDPRGRTRRVPCRSRRLVRPRFGYPLPLPAREAVLRRRRGGRSVGPAIEAVVTVALDPAQDPPK